MNCLNSRFIIALRKKLKGLIMKMSFKNFIIMSPLLLSVSCMKGLSNYEAKTEILQNDGDAIITDASFTFGGLSEITDVTNSSLVINWDSHPDAEQYLIYEVSQSKPQLVAGQVGSTKKSIQLNDLSPSTTYKFRVRMFTQGKQDTNSYDLTVTTKPAPSEPTIGLSHLSISPGFSATPSFKVEGIRAGQTIRLFADSDCSQAIGESVASTHQLTLNSDELPVGNNKIYVKAFNGDNASTCSTTFAQYKRLEPFSGIGSVNEITDTTAVISWKSHPEAVAYDIFDLTEDGPSYLGGLSGQNSTQLQLTNLIPNRTYQLRVYAKLARGNYDDNQVTLSASTRLNPEVPNSVSLLSPLANPDFASQVEVEVSGVKTGDRIELHSNGLCDQKVAEGIASGNKVKLTFSVPFGSNQFFAKSVNQYGFGSVCSQSHATYTRLMCPTNYIPVPANASLGITSPFCVAKYEMKKVNNAAASRHDLPVWTNISRVNSKIQCTNLGPKYDLISNPEWMTIALDLENVASNWGSGVVGQGPLYKGINASNLGLAASADDTQGYFGIESLATQPMGSGKEQRRTMTLSNGQVIWDFAGHNWEWVDWSVGGPLDNAPACNQVLHGSLLTFQNNCQSAVAADFMPSNPANISLLDYTSANYNIGTLTGGTTQSLSRGQSGIFGLSLAYGNTYTTPNFGFRCVYRP
jgi:hypothetical protein